MWVLRFKGDRMKRSKYSDEQILAIVKEGEAGRKVADLCRTHGITEQTYYRWKAKYGGMELSEMQRLRQLGDVGADPSRSQSRRTHDNASAKVAVDAAEVIF
jgi:putative transposase